jgi:hypothetical protein
VDASFQGASCTYPSISLRHTVPISRKRELRLPVTSCIQYLLVYYLGSNEIRIHMGIIIFCQGQKQKIYGFRALSHNSQLEKSTSRHYLPTLITFLPRVFNIVVLRTNHRGLQKFRMVALGQVNLKETSAEEVLLHENCVSILDCYHVLVTFIIRARGEMAASISNSETPFHCSH